MGRQYAPIHNISVACCLFPGSHSVCPSYFLAHFHRLRVLGLGFPYLPLFRVNTTVQFELLDMYQQVSYAPTLNVFLYKHLMAVHYIHLCTTLETE